VILVEGYTDVLALHQAGIENAVACCGTALISNQVEILSGLAKNIVLLYDADEAGARAAIRSIDLALEGCMEPYVVRLPPGEDPDSYVTLNGGAALRDYIEKHRKGTIRFLHDHFASHGMLDTPEGKADASHVMLSSISKVADEGRRKQAIQQASDLLGASFEVLSTTLTEKYLSPRHETPPVRRMKEEHHRNPRTTTDVPTDIHAAEKLLLGYMLKAPADLLDKVFTKVNADEFSDGPLRALFQEIGRRREEGKARGVPKNFEEEFVGLVTELVSKLPEKYTLSPRWSEHGILEEGAGENFRASLYGAIRKLKIESLSQRIRDVQDRIGEASEAEKKRLLRTLQKLLAKRNLEKEKRSTDP